MIKHEPQFDTDKIFECYSKKDDAQVYGKAMVFNDARVYGKRYKLIEVEKS